MISGWRVRIRSRQPIPERTEARADSLAIRSPPPWKQGGGFSLTPAAVSGVVSVSVGDTPICKSQPRPSTGGSHNREPSADFWIPWTDDAVAGKRSPASRSRHFFLKTKMSIIEIPNDRFKEMETFLIALGAVTDSQAFMQDGAEFIQRGKATHIKPKAFNGRDWQLVIREIDPLAS